jgi:CRP/FNR family cyclic AMP-dependent transcriptional regulator
MTHRIVVCARQGVCGLADWPRVAAELVHDGAVLRRLFERDADHEVEIPVGAPLTDADLKAGLLREVDLFAGMTLDQLREISRTLPMTACRTGGLITSPDEDGERLYIVKRGRVRLYRLTADGKQLTLDILDKGRIVGRMSWLGQALNEVYAEAIEDAVVCSFTPEELRRLIDRFPGIGLNMIRYLSDRLAVSEREREVMAFRSVEQRLATRLLELAERFGQPAVDGVAIDARLTQQELADMIGTSRETLATTISALREQRVLEMHNQRVVIRDLERLRELSGTQGAPARRGDAGGLD